MPQYNIYTAQKAWIALEATETDYEFKEIGLYGMNGKPGWFMKLNPEGTVPVLDCGPDGVYADSDLILDKVGGEESPKVSEWRTMINRMLPVGKMAVQGGSRPRLMEKLEELDAMVTGPYLCGKDPTMADCHAFPFLWRLGTEFDLDSCPNIQRWLQHCEDNNPAFRKTIQSAWWWWW